MARACPMQAAAPHPDDRRESADQIPGRPAVARANAPYYVAES
jgi:hypothetical protein